MAPQNGGVLHQKRDDDDAESIYNRPIIMFFGLLLLCFCIMAPMFWMLWMMRNDNSENVKTEQRLNRIRNWERVRVAERQQQQRQHQAMQQAIVQDVGQTVVGTMGQNRLTNVFPKICKSTTTVYQAVASQLQVLRDKLSHRLVSITRAGPRRNRSQSRAGVSIDLPIMRQPAWQKLASGSVGITPSTTAADASKPTSTEIDLADMAGPRGHHQTMGHGSLMQQGLLAQHEGSDRVGAAELRHAQYETMVGLAMG